jgi:hypothetical protein
MNDEHKYKWPPILYFIMSGIAFGLSLYLITDGAVKSEARANVDNIRVASATGAEPYGGEDRVRILLRRDEKNSFGKVDVVYRGIDDGHVKLDVFIRDLDPHYPYHRKIAYRTAKEGFHLGGLRFELISAGRTKAKLVWLRKG